MSYGAIRRAWFVGASGAALLTSLAATSASAWTGAELRDAQAAHNLTSSINAAIMAADAQEASPQDRSSSVDDVIVTGVRQALATSSQIKKNADTFVDSITATDIGAFPDKSAAEALARVPGITVNRLQSADNSTHPSGEPTGVLIRGLTQVRTEFNGRDTFSADSARGLQFNDVSPELLAGVDSYKNQTAEMIEGGLAGTVNLRTRVPFDQKGLLITGNFKQNYGDRSGEWTPEYSALISNTWDTEVGRFGALASFASSDVVTRTESVIMDKIDTYCSAGFGTTDKANLDSSGNVTCTANPFGGTGFVYAPDGIRFSQVDYDRQRRGIAAALQYENNAGNLRATVQYIESKYDNAWLERASHVKLDGSYFGTPAFNPRGSSVLLGSTGLTFGADGMLQSGLLTQGAGSWGGTWESPQAALNAGQVAPGVPFVKYCGDGACGPDNRNGLYLENEARNFDHSESTRDLSANISWDPTDKIHVNLDVQYIDASVSNNDILVATSTMANVDYSVNKDGTPQVRLLPGSNNNYAAGGFANPHNYFIPFIQGHVEDNDGNEFAARGDVSYKFDDGSWFDKLSVGLRIADRKQTVRYSTFNWTPIAAAWHGCAGPGFNADNTTPGAYPTGTDRCGGNVGRAPFQGYGAGIWESTTLDNFYNGSVYDNGPLVYLNRETLRDFPRLVDALGPRTNAPFGGYTPICDRADATVDGCFTPGELLKVNEKTQAAYAMLRFGGDDHTIFGNVTVAGNVGLRYVRTEENSDGSVAFPHADVFAGLAACGAPLSGNNIVNPACYLTPEIRAFANGAVAQGSYKSSYTNWLPSLNLRFGLDDQNFIRFAYSRAMSRPDIGLLRNTLAINAPVYSTTADSPYIVYKNPSAPHTPDNVAGYNFVFLANSGNAALKPLTADQFDLSYERYVGRNTSLAAGLFYKKLYDAISFGQFTRDVANGNSTQTVQINGPSNNDGDSGSLTGLELSYQSFFDFLPGWLSGLGAQANYTYVHQSGINNSNLFTASSSGDVGAFGAGQQSLGGAGNVIDSHRLAGVSTHTYNVVGLYEKGPLGFRLAYNWRSRYLTQNLDCCIGLPVFQKAAGFLDASLRYSINNNIELSFDATNLLNTTTRYEQQIFGDSPQTPGASPVFRDCAWSRVDRRYQIGIRAKF